MEDRPTVFVREMRADEAQRFLLVHHEAVRGIAAKDYAREIVDEWAPMPISPEAVDRVIANPEHEVRIVAEIGGEIAGIAVVVPDRNELRACYVMPKVARRGVGTALVSRLEEIAKLRGVKYLELESSITAEHFYAALGYKTLEHGEHVMSTGGRMACVKMRKKISD